MLKQKKKSKYKYKKLTVKSYNKLKRLFNSKPYILKPTFQNLLENQNIEYLLTFRITANNVFCNLKDLNKKKTLIVCSAGKYKLNVSKKTVKFSHKIIIQKFLEEIDPSILTSFLLINISGPKKIKKQVIKSLSNFLEKKNYIIDVKNNKCFNGCRPSKKKRKKQKRFRITK